jgi:hypothetical protein
MNDKTFEKTRVGSGIRNRQACGQEKSSRSVNITVNASGERRKEDKPAMSLYQPIDIDGGDEGEVSHSVR